MELIKVDENMNVDGQTLHDLLHPKYKGSTKHLRHWIESMKEWGFKEGKDYFKHKTKVGKTYKNVYIIPIGTAKEFSMLSKSRIGRIFRKYFILCEERLKQVAKLEYINATENLVTCINTKEDYINTLEERLKQVAKLEYTACISDICCRFVDCKPWTVVYNLMCDGYIDKRLNGSFPSVNAPTGFIPYTDCEGKSYVRYNDDGEMWLMNYLKNELGYKLK